jgi:hypothetical protein
VVTIRYTIVVDVNEQKWAEEYGLDLGLLDKARDDAAEYYTQPDALNEITAAVQKLAGFDPTVTATAEVL